MDYDLTREQQKLQENAARFCVKEIAPFAKTLDRCSPAEKNLMMKNNLKKLGDDGFLGAGHRADTMDMIDVYLAGHEIAKACPATFISSRASAFLCAGAIRLFGSPEQKKRYLPGLTDGTLTGALACSENQAGSDLSAITSSAHVSGETWVLDGNKSMVVNAPIADIMLVLARNDISAPAESGMSIFIIEKNAEGLAPGDMIETMGLRGAPIAALLMDNCRSEGILGDMPGNGLTQVRRMQSAGAIGITSMCTGIGTMCMEISVTHARERKAFGRSIGMFQDVGFRLADMFTLNDLGRMMALRAAGAWNNSDPDAVLLSACAKLFTAEACTKTAGMAMGIFAGHGYVSGTEIERLYRDARFCEICEGTPEILRDLIAKHEFDRFA